MTTSPSLQRRASSGAHHSLRNGREIMTRSPDSFSKRRHSHTLPHSHNGEVHSGKTIKIRKVFLRAAAFLLVVVNLLSLRYIIVKMSKQQTQSTATTSETVSSFSGKSPHDNNEKVNPQSSLKNFVQEKENTILKSNNNNNDLNNNPHPQSSQTASSSYQSNDILYFDHIALQNIHATYEGAHSHIEWTVPPTESEKNAFHVAPHLATVDRRPIIIRKQVLDDKKRQRQNKQKQSLTEGGDLLGCAISSTTFVSNLQSLDSETFASQHQKNKGQQQSRHEQKCEVCFQFSNLRDMNNFASSSVTSYLLKRGIGNEDNGGIGGIGGETTATTTIFTTDTQTSTKCFAGEVTLTARFAKWQHSVSQTGDGEETFPGYGYPWTVDCILPDGIPELTCREISRRQRSISMEEENEGESEEEGLLNIYYKTAFGLDARLNLRQRKKTLVVHSKWPWRAMMSHDDDRSKIAKRLSMVWNDDESWFVPNSAEDMKLAHVEGPGYDQTDIDGKPSLQSMAVDPNSTGGIHTRLLVNLFHLMRNAPGSTHMIATVDGQVKRSYQHLTTLLNTKISELYPSHWHLLMIGKHDRDSTHLIPFRKRELDSTILSKEKASSSGNMTLMELLRMRRMKIHLIPVMTPSFIFEKTVCAGQYSFAPYLAARYAADYQVMMFIDGDTAFMEKSTTLQNIFYDRFFSPDKSTQCAGHRFQMFEQYVSPENNNESRVLECTQDLVSDRQKWDYAMKNCKSKHGHIVGRTDSIYAFSVHHPDTLVGYAPEGVEDCITPNNEWSARFFLMESETVQLHLRSGMRKAECACFVNHPLPDSAVPRLGFQVS